MLEGLAYSIFNMDFITSSLDRKEQIEKAEKKERVQKEKEEKQKKEAEEAKLIEQKGEDKVNVDVQESVGSKYEADIHDHSHSGQVRWFCSRILLIKQSIMIFRIWENCKEMQLLVTAHWSMQRTFF